MSSSEVYTRGFKSQAERLSLKYREDMGLKAWEPLCAFKLARFLNVHVTTPFEVFELQADAERLCESADRGWSALLMHNQFGEKVVLHNRTHSSARQQSNIMHELAHMICNHEIPEEYKKMNLPFSMVYHNDRHEAEASYLGAALQLSKPCLFWGLKRNMSYSEIAAHFNASEEMVKYRINISGVAQQKRKIAPKDNIE